MYVHLINSDRRVHTFQIGENVRLKIKSISKNKSESFGRKLKLESLTNNQIINGQNRWAYHRAAWGCELWYLYNPVREGDHVDCMASH